MVVGLGLVLLVCPVTACSTYSSKKAKANYGPSESVLEVVAVLRRHVSDDTYRFPPAVDYTERNVYRASLLRLESIERVHADALRSGYMQAVIPFAKGRALERLRAYDLAAQHYRLSASFEGELREPALDSARRCQQIADAVAVGIDLLDPLTIAPDVAARPADATEVVAALDDRIARLTSLLEDNGDSHYRYILQEEIERAEMTRARYFEDMRFVLPDGTIRALAELQRVARRHGGSKNRLKHMLDVANFYVTLAEEYVDAVPPQSLRFDPPHFRELTDSATQLYEVIAGNDGTPEKLEATRRLEAFLAFTLKVDRDRFTP